MTADIAITLTILVITAILFITEKIPLALTAIMSAVALSVFGIITPEQAFAGFVNENIIIFFSMFIVGMALFETGAAGLIGGIVIKIAKTEKSGILFIFLITAFMSGILSNTGTAAVMIPIVLGIAAKGVGKKSKLLMVMGVAANMGGGLSLVGTPPNLIVQGALQDATGQSFGFFEFGIVAFPAVILTAIYYWFWGYKNLPDINKDEDLSKVDLSEAEVKQFVPWKRTASIIILIITVLAMILEEHLPWPLHISSAIGAIIVVLIKLMTEKEAYKSVNMSSIFLFSGTLAFATGLQVSGAGAFIAKGFIGLFGEEASPMALLIAILVVSSALTNFMSNTATTALLAPLAVSISAGLGAAPHAVLMATAFGSTLAYLTPIGTPPLTMIYGLGGYKFTDYPKMGWPLMIICFVVAIIFLPIFFPFFP